MGKNGDGGKRLWITGFGWATVDGMDIPPNPGYEFATEIDEQHQTDYITGALAWVQEWGHVEGLFVHNLNAWSASGPENEMAKYSIVRSDWSPRPAYIALKKALDSTLPKDALLGTGTFSWPTNGTISWHFGFNAQEGVWHGGLDIATRKGVDLYLGHRIGRAGLSGNTEHIASTCQGLRIVIPLPTTALQKKPPRVCGGLFVYPLLTCALIAFNRFITSFSPRPK
jgi:hypothetical protein